MCIKDCCALKSALTLRRIKLLTEKQREEEANASPKPTILTPQTLIYSFEEIQKMADFIIARTQIHPKFGLVCGSNLDVLAELIENPIVIDYSEIPKFPLCTDNLQHKGKMFVGTLMGATVIAMQGRLHLYEGNSLASCSMPVRMMNLCGVEYVFLTCASSGVNKAYNVGDILLIKDHINILGMLGSSPLIGPNDLRFGNRHFSLVNAYDMTLLNKAKEIAQEIGYDDRVHTGVYGCLGGPVYETLAEHRLLRQIGVDAVGMSLVQEVLYARHSRMKVFSFSLISVPDVENQDIPDKLLLSQLEQGKNVCMELLSRMIYKIQNNL